MAYTKKNYTKEDKERWAQAAKQNREELSQIVLETAKGYQTHPGDIAEFLSFSSRFYNYSVRNSMLIHSQAPYATFVGSFDFWKSKGASIQKGSKGIKILSPAQKIILKIDGDNVPLSEATKEQRAAYRAGSIEGEKKTVFKIGNVFDISQTNFPKSEYPKLYHMGVYSGQHAAIAKGLVDFSQEILQVPVAVLDLQSISLRGAYYPVENKIQLSDKLESTALLSTLAHELGHAVLHGNPGSRTKSTALKEFEADAFSIMVESHYGIPLTDSRKQHLSDHYKTLESKAQAKGEEPQLEAVLGNVHKIFTSHIQQMEQSIQPYLSVVQDQVAIDERAKAKEKGAQTMTKGAYQDASRHYSRQEAIEAMKREIQIVDYAQTLGLTPVRVGRYYSLREYDSVRIDPDRNCFFRNSSGRSGSIIDFVMEFQTQGDLHEALRELTPRLYDPTQTDYLTKEERQAVQREGNTPVQEPAVKGLELPQRGENMKRVFAYLTKSRYVDPDIVQDFVDRKQLYQDTRGNCVFVARDEAGAANFACFRGTLTEKRFLGDVKGSDYSKDFYIQNGSKELIVTESVIDAMSVMSILKAQGKEYKEYDYLALTGTGKYESLFNHLEERPMEHVLLALDADAAGFETAKKLSSRLLEESKAQVTFHVPGTAKDWNEQLIAGFRKMEVDKINFMEPVPTEMMELIYQELSKEQQEKEKNKTPRIQGLSVEQDQIFATVEKERAEEITPLCRDENGVFVPITEDALLEVFERYDLSEDELQIVAESLGSDPIELTEPEREEHKLRTRRNQNQVMLEEELEAER
ncbi:MAG: DUF3991 domain-containing protein [Lachnospiraceae bacterium]